MIKQTYFAGVMLINYAHRISEHLAYMFLPTLSKPEIDKNDLVYMKISTNSENMLYFRSTYIYL